VLNDMGPVIVLFNRDLRLHDHPALSAALDAADRVIPLFVLERSLLRTSVNRATFLLDCLADLRIRLRRRGGELVITEGDPVGETLRLATEHRARAVFVSADVTSRARRRETRLADECARARIEFRACPGVTVIPPADLAPANGDHYRVFTPYWRAWLHAARRPVLAAPRQVRVPPGLRVGRVPRLTNLVDRSPSPRLAPGGETEARRRLRSWARSGLNRGVELAADGTSRSSPYLHFGCVSALELAERFDRRDGGEHLLRQLCWRDFHHQVASAFPAIATDEYRSRGDRWRRSQGDFEAWMAGRTGYPIVDAGLRQLHEEGWLSNRARLITASFLTKDLYLDWRLGARHFMEWLVDGDVANNSGNWQWVAGTGNDTRPNRVLNPLRQAQRHDPRGDYVRRYVPELAAVKGPEVHRPWVLEPSVRAQLDYPDPIVDHDEATGRLRTRRRRG
jgi:deoxyribodipyrimidine photo-lyase